MMPAIIWPLKRRIDGGWGWVVVASAFLSQVLLGGIIMTGGLFYVMYRNAFNSAPVETSWLCALPMTLWFYSAPIGSFLTNRYGYRVCAFIGGVITATGLSLSFFAPNIAFLFFSHGILTGMGFGINFTACMAALNAYFDHYKTLATGFCSVGLGVGQVLYSIFVVFLEETYGWRGSLLIHSAITLHLCVCALIFVPMTSSVLTASPKVDKYSSSYINVEYSDLKTKRRQIKNKQTLIDFSVFKNLIFICFCVSNIFVNVSIGIFILHIPSYAEENGFTGEAIGMVLTFHGTANLIGKVVFSIIDQHPRADVTVVYMTSLILTGVFNGLTPVFTSRVGILTIASLSGFFYCVTGALLPAIIFRIVGYDHFSDGIGLSMPFKGTGSLIGGPLSGFLYAKTLDYSTSFYVSGLCMVLGGLFTVPCIIKHFRDRTMAKLSTNAPDTNRRMISGSKQAPELLTSNLTV